MIRDFFDWFGTKKSTDEREIYEYLIANIDSKRMPQHIAIIMDGNGRWAMKRGMPRIYGHRAGVESLREIVKTCSELKMPVLTVYAFSTENWKRPKEEVDALMSLLVEYVYREIEELHKNKVKIRAIGRIHELPESCQEAVRYAMKFTEENTGLNFNLALNYGGRVELTDAVRKIGEKIQNGSIRIDEIDGDLISDNLYTKGLPDPDLLIRPAGDYRVSNFLIWQLAYTEFWYTDVLWPDFKKLDLLKAIYDFQQRERRFGGLPK